MVLSRRQIVSLLAISTVSSIALISGPAAVDAASIIGTVGVTVEESGGVGTVTTPTPTPTPSVTTTTSTTTSGFSIPTTPAPSATSLIGSGPVAPVQQTSDSTAEAGSGSSSSFSGTSGKSTAPRFSNPNVSSAGLGRASSVAVAGSPNQTFSVMLPALTMYSSSGQLITLSNFQHNAGSTPFLGNDGAAFFNVGAQVNQSPVTTTTPGDGGDNDQNALQQLVPGVQSITSSLSDAILLGGDRATVLAAAFTNRAPYVNIVVSYN